MAYSQGGRISLQGAWVSKPLEGATEPVFLLALKPGGERECLKEGEMFVCLQAKADFA